MARTYDDSMFTDTFEHEYTWLNGFLRNVRRFENKTALLDPELEKSWTYFQVNQEANRLAHALQKDSIHKDDVILGALRNSPEFAFTYIGPRKIGAIFLAANYNLAAGEMALLIQHNQPKVIIYSAFIKDVITEAVALSGWKPFRLIMADNTDNASLPESHVSWEDYLNGMSDEEPEIDFRPHIYDEVLRLCTSGTTALPKSVPINRINEVLSAHDVIMHYPMNQFDVNLNLTPWFHRGGCHSGGICPVFYSGATILVMRKFKPQTALKWVEKYGITFLMGAPAGINMLCKIQERYKYNLSNLKGIIAMGSPLTQSDARKFSAVLSPRIFNGYGTTETFWNAFLQPCDIAENAGAAGLSCTDDEVRVVNLYKDKKAEPDDMVPRDSTTEGEIIVFCPGKTTYSYYNNKKLSEEKFYKGWVYTGDRGTWNESWMVTVCGRKDDMIVVSGENIYPTQIEDVINQNPKVKDCLVTSVPDEMRGEAVAAYVVKESPDLTAEELSEYCTASPLLSLYKRPRWFCFVNEIPVSATGKKRRNLMKKQAAEDLKNGKLFRG